MAEDTTYMCPECGGQLATDSETGETVCSGRGFAVKKGDIDNRLGHAFESCRYRPARAVG